MSWLRFNAALVVPLFLASTALAAGGDVCLFDSTKGDAFILKRLRVPKRPADAVAVAGFGLTSMSGQATLPLSGALVRDPGGSGGLRMNLVRGFERCFLGFNLDANLAGTVNYDCNLDNSSDETDAVSVIDCADIGF